MENKKLFLGITVGGGSVLILGLMAGGQWVGAAAVLIIFGLLAWAFLADRPRAR